MSLLKQLLLSVTVAMVVIVAGTLAFSIGSARTYLNAQVGSESANAAVSLAITLSQPVNQDPVIRELLLMALYDTGRFQEVRFTSAQGQVLFERRRDSLGKGGTVPGWFRWALPLETPVATGDVSDGWKQVGQLTVVGDNGYAYESLWHSALRQLMVVLVAGLLWALAVIMLVRWLRRALDQHVASQVRAIAVGGDMPQLAANPLVRELNSLISEITQVRERVRANVDEMDAKIESLKLELHQDAVTGLANRKYFLNELRRVLQDEDDSGGHVMLLRIRDLAAVNAAHSRQEVDVWLRHVAEEMQATSRRVDVDSQVARLNGSDFAILMPGLTGPQATHFAQGICSHVRDLCLTLPDGRLSRWAFSLTDYAAGQEAGVVLSLLDHGLMRAESAGHVDVEYLPREGGTASRASASEGEWRALLRRALEEDGFRLQAKGIRYEGMSLVERYDASLQLRDGTEWLPGSLFMPVAVRLNLSAECDLRAIELAAEWIKANRQDLVIRVSLASLMQPRFWPALQQVLESLTQQPVLARFLSFELDAHGLVVCPEQIQQFCQAAKDISARVGLRRLDAEPSALAKLHLAPMDYVRLTGPLIDTLSEGVGGVELLRAIRATARELRLAVISDAPNGYENRRVLREHDVSVALR